VKKRLPFELIELLDVKYASDVRRIIPKEAEQSAIFYFADIDPESKFYFKIIKDRIRFRKNAKKYFKFYLIEVLPYVVTDLKPQRLEVLNTDLKGNFETWISFIKKYNNVKIGDTESWVNKTFYKDLTNPYTPEFPLLNSDEIEELREYFVGLSKNLFKHVEKLEDDQLENVYDFLTEFKRNFNSYTRDEVASKIAEIWGGIYVSNAKSAHELISMEDIAKVKRIMLPSNNPAPDPNLGQQNLSNDHTSH